ncbi:hypothetical protein [Pseudooceanicola algae]|uniref:Uncharacterized protein n=1 Tax=Pseudooceanicola algae TaxID=1537215 RepID=A0A418SFQ1_9RHOB|nr:hypothetical protein [Pseudooceanicola algae]QPM91519.1 hypothetical protein PSAL_027720 [Pseudooceanicola algae]
MTRPILALPVILAVLAAGPAVQAEGIVGLDDPTGQLQIQNQLRQGADAQKRLKLGNQASQQYVQDLDTGTPPSQAAQEYRQRLKQINGNTLGGQPLFYENQIPGSILD